MFNALARLPDDVVVYYEPIIDNRHPDFVVILPRFGVLLIEVKGWIFPKIKSADSHSVQVHDGQRLVEHAHPLRQVRDYKFLLMDRCRKDKQLSSLVNFSGPYTGKFQFPFASCAIFSNISREQLNTWPERLRGIFPSKTVATKDQLASWEAMHPADLMEVLQGYFDTFLPDKPMSKNQVNIVKAIIHPEILLGLDFGSVTQSEEPTVKVLDAKQEQLARQVGAGHRLVFGVAGSGKTVLLIARAKLVARLNPSARVLVLCYNFMLSSYLAEALKDLPSVTIRHFHRWANENGVGHDIKDDSEMGDAFSAKLKAVGPKAEYYDSILIDEAQDFDSTWFPCVLAAMKDPVEGELLIVGDGNQGLYRRRKVSWKKLGIQAAGRTQYLEQSYRNTRPMLRLARIFAATKVEADEDGLGAPWVDPEQCVRVMGSSPVLLHRQSKQNEVDRVVRVVGDLLDGRWFGETIVPLKPDQIGILYRIKDERHIRALCQSLTQVRKECPAVWLSENKTSRGRLAEPGVKVLTMHSSKGLQFKAVIVLFADTCPTQFPDSNEEEERSLFYVALTRAEDYLVISCSGRSKFIDEIVAAEADKSDEYLSRSE